MPCRTADIVCCVPQQTVSALSSSRQCLLPHNRRCQLWDKIMPEGGGRDTFSGGPPKPPSCINLMYNKLCKYVGPPPQSTLLRGGHVEQLYTHTYTCAYIYIFIYVYIYICIYMYIHPPARSSVLSWPPACRLPGRPTPPCQARICIPRYSNISQHPLPGFPINKYCMPIRM